jgi:hypothetical protein
MNQVRMIYYLARADFLERVRRYSFLIMLGLIVFLGYQAAIGNIYVQVGSYRGEFNSAWVGSMMSAIASVFLGWFGFYLVKGSVARDRETGVGQILATTPLTRPLYTLGKWFSNFAVLVSMIVILAVTGVIIQFLTGESSQMDLLALLTPFLFVTLPTLALVAAVAVLFETIGFLSGGFGNIIYFFLFAMVIPLGDALTKNNPALEPLGISLLQQSMGAEAKAVFPDYDGGFMLGSTDIPAKGIFHWSGVSWSTDIILQRITIFGLAVVLTLLASLFFDRFDLSRQRPRRSKSTISNPTPQEVSTPRSLSQPILLHPLTGHQGRFRFIRVLISELKFLLKGQRWWWYAGALGLFAVSLVVPIESVRTHVLPFVWIWPILIWSGMGNREIQNNAQQMVFSSAAPLMRQLPASWLAGFIVALLTGSGAALKMLIAGDGVGLLAWFSAALFIPSFALALGVWSNSHKLFEVLYVIMWYAGPMNYVYAVDYIGTKGNGNVGFFIPFSIALVLAAFFGRARQVQN